MIDIEYRFLSQSALEHLLLKIAFQQGADGDVAEMSLDDKKNMLLNELERGHARLICYPEAGWFDIVPAEYAFMSGKLDECL